MAGRACTEDKNLVDVLSCFAALKLGSVEEPDTPDTYLEMEFESGQLEDGGRFSLVRESRYVTEEDFPSLRALHGLAGEAFSVPEVRVREWDGTLGYTSTLVDEIPAVG